MESWKNRPEIEANDHPNTVCRALLASHAIWYAEQPQDVARAWDKKAQDATGAIQDGFTILEPNMEPLNPDGRALLHMSGDELKYALVGYGCELIDEDPQANDAEIRRVDELLASADKALK